MRHLLEEAYSNFIESIHKKRLNVLSYQDIRMMFEESNSEINDDYFKHPSTFTTSKHPTPIKHEVASSSGTTQTLEGPVRHEKGHHIITGPKGEKYPVAPEKFKQLYDDKGDGTATPKRIEKQARLADRDGVLKTSWGDLNYQKGKHYIVRHGSGDYGAVEKDIFHQTYDQSNNTENKPKKD